MVLLFGINGIRFTGLNLRGILQGFVFISQLDENTATKEIVSVLLPLPFPPWKKWFWERKKKNEKKRMRKEIMPASSWTNFINSRIVKLRDFVAFMLCYLWNKLVFGKEPSQTEYWFTLIRNLFFRWKACQKK